MNKWGQRPANQRLGKVGKQDIPVHLIQRNQNQKLWKRSSPQSAWCSQQQQRRWPRESLSLPRPSSEALSLRMVRLAGRLQSMALSGAYFCRRPNPQTILKTAQDVFPHHMEKTGLGVAPVLADLTPTSDLEGLHVVGWLKPPLMWGRGPEKLVTPRADTAPFMWPTPAPLQWDEAAALERQWGQRVPDSTSSEEVQDQRHVSPHQWVDANHWGSKQR